MPPKGGGGGKLKGGAAKKAEAAASKESDKAAAAEAAEAATWEKGAKGKGASESKAEKAAEAARKKAEREKLLAEEEASLPSKPVKKAGGGAKKDQPKKPSQPPPGTGLDEAISSFSASNIDDALEAMSLATERTDKAAVGAKAGAIERHPERRFKAAFEAYKEREMPRIRQERPGLRKNQYENELHDEFKKHPDNPFNQLQVSYDATQEEKVEVLAKQRELNEKRLAGA
ncbi:Uncharacterized conserved protein [Ceraceosorus bombacis]|uniref:Uncharacterized conserved protein n=1 Tax=Ceraceosorus bombacis TaxID=401625 RepID=A0A0P1BPM5_9BASI|nr:Uncharacterized conserved protein [Ceraceosorus bombacis]